MSETGLNKELLSEHKVTVAVITLTLFIIFAAAVSTIIIVIVIGPKPAASSDSTQYFNGSFRILNLNFTSDYKQTNSAAFKTLADQIKDLLSSTFQNSSLKNQFNMSQITSLRAGSVIPEFVLLFNNHENNSSSGLVQKIFKENLVTSKTIFDIDATSLQLTEISSTAAQSILSGSETVNIYTVSPTVQTSPQNYSVCGIGGPTKSSAKIVGGTNASPGAWPWQASLHLGGIHSCGASLISDTWLVTAAHCFDWNTDVNAWTVVLGSINLTSGSGLKLEKIIIYENYTSTTHANDIALIKLSTPVNFTQYIRPVCLPDKSNVFADNSSCYVTGWGLLKEEGIKAPPVLQQAEVKIISTGQCSSAAMYGSYIRPSMICAGYANGGIDTCQGDSGGPLVATQSDGSWYLTGIVSFGKGCAAANKPTVYSRVTYLRSWIMAVSGL
ncbi:transmembrane protease serine 11B [Pelobates cultripes]|uniref:Transmembrane protease serine 11B n=1 Tax=Pelobates cultripes TaxID=61616 RepID=A0AAD1WF06_PELCU|nr:transmembrane protease serine 11B [Pelobates cultripes]